MVPHKWISAMLRMVKRSSRPLSSIWGYVDVLSVVVAPIYGLSALLISRALFRHVDAPRAEPLGYCGETAIPSRRGVALMGTN